ncbi:MAG: DHH family phosphoesterase [bacterium]|nr:DHH family phosphoesterase [bacterium]
MNPPPLANNPVPPACDAARTEVLRTLLASRKRLLIMTHNNPDPDSLGGAMGLAEFARQVAGIEADFAITGRILRAENQAMVRELGIETTPLESVKLDDYDCFAVVDTQPGFGHTFVPEGVEVDIVIDHHVCAEATGGRDVGFHEVLTDMGATSSIVAAHLQNAGVRPSADVATALCYGIKTDTADLSRNVSDLDLRAYEYLFPHVDRKRLVAIQSPRLPAAYFQQLKDALSKVRLYDGVTLCSLGRTPSPEMVAEIADLLKRMEGVRAVFCGGQAGDSYYVSVRTEVGSDAWSLLRDVMGDEDGSCGGHGSVAGGTIHLGDGDSRALKRLERRLERNILRSMGVSGCNAAGLGDADD